jgi:hypothetical protein
MRITRPGAGNLSHRTTDEERPGAGAVPPSSARPGARGGATDRPH